MTKEENDDFYGFIIFTAPFPGEPVWFTREIYRHKSSFLPDSLAVG